MSVREGQALPTSGLSLVVRIPRDPTSERQSVEGMGCEPSTLGKPDMVMARSRTPGSLASKGRAPYR